MSIFKKIMTLIISMFIIAGITYNSYAQDATSGATKMKGKPGMMKNPEGKTEGLTKEQQDKIDQLHLGFSKELIGLKNQIAEKKAHLKTISMVDQPDMAAVNKTIDELYALKADIAKKRSTMIQEIRKILTPEQRIHFDMQHSKKCKGRCEGTGPGSRRPFPGKPGPGMGPGCRHMGPGCMQNDPVYDRPEGNDANKKDNPPADDKK